MTSLLQDSKMSCKNSSCSKQEEVGIALLPSTWTSQTNYMPKCSHNITIETESVNFTPIKLRKTIDMSKSSICMKTAWSLGRRLWCFRGVRKMLIFKNTCPNMQSAYQPTGNGTSSIGHFTHWPHWKPCYSRFTSWHLAIMWWLIWVGSGMPSFYKSCCHWSCTIAPSSSSTISPTVSDSTYHPYLTCYMVCLIFCT